MIYLFIVLQTIIFIYLFDIKKKRKGKYEYFLLYCIAVLLIGFRYRIGGDTFNYMQDYESFPKLQDLTLLHFAITKYAPLWIIISSTVKTISEDFIFFQFIHTLIINSVVFYFISKHATHRFSCILFYFIYYFLYFNTEILRESISIMFFLLSIQYYYNKKWIAYYFLIILAYMFHYSAIFLFILPLFRNYEFSTKNLLKLTIGMSFMPLIISIAVSYLPEPIQIYFKEFIIYQSNWKGIFLVIITYCIFPFIIIYIYKMNKKNDKDFFAVFYIPFFLVALFSIYNAAIGARFMNYFIPLAGIFFVNFLYEIWENNYIHPKQLVIIFFIGIILISKGMYYFTDTSDTVNNTRFYIRYYPYTNVFFRNNDNQKKIIKKRETWVYEHFRLESLKSKK